MRKIRFPNKIGGGIFLVPLRRVLAKDHFRLYGGTVPCTVSEKIKAKVSIYNRRNPDETPHAKKTQSPELIRD